MSLPDRFHCLVVTSQVRGRVAVMLLLVAACSSTTVDDTPPSRTDPATLPAGTLIVRTPTQTVTIPVEIARTEEDRAIGLMHRTELAADAGMAFLFDQPTEGPFWMKDTLIPLSIGFWDQEGRINRILDMEPCRADPCPLYSPGVTYVGAVEVNQGFFERNHIRAGDSVEMGSR